MRSVHRTVLGLSCAWLLSCPASAQADVQDAAVPAPAGVRVYLDCSDDCFEEYLRSELEWIDFVRQPQDADIHVLTTTADTGGGGIERVLRLVGLGRWAHVEHELRAVSPPAEPEDAQRDRVRDAIVVGVLGFLARSGLPSDLEIAVASTASGPSRTVASDPWDAWVFTIGTDNELESEESSRVWNWQFEATADRVTNDWKIGFGASIEQEKETFDLDEDEPFSVARRERQGDWFVAKSLGDHWSFGLDGDLDSSTFDNIRLRAGVMPMVEFNLFPYRQYATRQLRVEYGVGAEHSRYNEVTLFDKMRETLGRHEVSVTLDQRQPWGTVQAGVEWSQYLHDLGISRLEFDGTVSIRLARGFSVEFEGSASRIRDQLSLPRRGATPEEVLLRLRQLQSGHEVNLTFGLSYSFGSIFNSIVNPRFGR
jgi:hypothetical protein